MTNIYIYTSLRCVTWHAWGMYIHPKVIQSKWSMCIYVSKRIALDTYNFFPSFFSFPAYHCYIFNVTIIVGISKKHWPLIHLQVTSVVLIYLLFLFFLSSARTCGSVCIAPPAIKVGKHRKKSIFQAVGTHCPVTLTS